MASSQAQAASGSDRTRRRRRVAVSLVAAVVILVWVLALVLLWRGGAFRVPFRGGAAARPPGHSPGQPATTTAPAQPAADGYEYLVTEERYVVPDDPGRWEIQERRRESWRAPHGWAWARQTGTDPGRFIFAPYTDWKPLRQVRANPADVEEAMNALLAPVPRSEIVHAQFNFVSSLLGVETLPAGALPVEFRSALVDVLRGQPGVTVTHRVRDPKGRLSTRLSFARVESGVRVTQSLYLDRKYEYLASTLVVEGSKESGSRVVIERRRADAIPRELLAEVGDQRVEQAVRDR